MAKTRQTSQLGEHLGYWLRFVSNHVSHAFKQKVESRGVTVAEWAVLRQLLGRSLQPNQLADELGMTRGAVSKLVERLVHKELVARSTSAADRRYHTLTLTAAGRRLVPTLARLADENDALHFGHLDAPQRSELMNQLKGIVQHHGWKDLPID
jgi:DNA-binding MarR family transcriptional regulator